MFFSQDDFDYEMKSPPMMVPMADALNHVAKNNAKLKFGKDSLKMVACQAIKQVGVKIGETNLIMLPYLEIIPFED